MIKPIDLFICCYLRPLFTEQTLIYLKERTKYPYRLFLINMGGNDDIAKVYKDDIFMTINLSKNAGVTAAWQMALALAESEYFITSDNDIYVPDLTSKRETDWDWLALLKQYMDERPDFAAISLSPHVLVGPAPIDPKDPEDVKERNMCGAVMRIMRRDIVRKVNGWADEGDKPLIRPDRGHEERTVCGRLQEAGYKTGIATRLRAFHPFGKNIEGNSGWGYPPEFPPELQGHTPELKEYVEQFDNMDAYDSKTWLPKI